MSHSIRIDSKSALVGIAAALVCVVAMGQVSVSRATTPTAAIAPGQGIGNPHPRDMVQLCSEATVPSSVDVAPGGEVIVFNVPSDRWLVVLPNGGNFGVSSNISNAVKIYQVLAGQSTLKATVNAGTAGSALHGPSRDTAGWTFEPGSALTIRNTSSSQAANVSHNLFGYLTKL